MDAVKGEVEVGERVEGLDEGRFRHVYIHKQKRNRTSRNHIVSRYFLLAEFCSESS